MSAGGVVVVSGGTFGIGRDIVLLLAERGYRVVAFGPDRRQEGSIAAGGVEQTRRELVERGLSGLVLDADVSSEGDVERVVAAAVENYGTVNGFVSNAAIRLPGRLTDISVEQLDASLAVNLRGPALCAKAVLPWLLGDRGGPRAIVVIGTGSAWGRPGLASYCASKAGLIGLTQSLALDYGPLGVRTNMVVPGGLIRSGMTLGDPRLAARLEARDSTESSVVTGRDVAEAVEFLLSRRALHINGACLDVGAPTVRFGVSEPGPVGGPGSGVQPGTVVG